MVARWTAMDKSVFIVLPSPTGHLFSPRRMIERSLSDLSFRILPPFISTPGLISRISPIVTRLRGIGARTGAHLIDPIATLCDPTQCPLLTEHGLPIYKDDAHLNPLFVRDNVRYLDDIFVLNRTSAWTERRAGLELRADSRNGVL
jgi:hypothetical protein